MELGIKIKTQVCGYQKEIKIFDVIYLDLFPRTCGAAASPSSALRADEEKVYPISKIVCRLRRHPILLIVARPTGC